MSFTFAIGCRLRHHGSPQNTGGVEWISHTLIVTRLEYLRDIVSLAECGPVQPGERRVSHRAFRAAAPTDWGTAGDTVFVPGRGSVRRAHVDKVPAGDRRSLDPLERPPPESFGALRRPAVRCLPS